MGSSSCSSGFIPGGATDSEHRVIHIYSMWASWDEMISGKDWKRVQQLTNISVFVCSANILQQVWPWRHLVKVKHVVEWGETPAEVNKAVIRLAHRRCPAADVRGRASAFVCVMSCCSAEGRCSSDGSVLDTTSPSTGPVRWPERPGGAVWGRLSLPDHASVLLSDWERGGGGDTRSLTDSRISLFLRRMNVESKPRPCSEGKLPAFITTPLHRHVVIYVLLHFSVSSSA